MSKLERKKTKNLSDEELGKRRAATHDLEILKIVTYRTYKVRCLACGNIWIAGGRDSYQFICVCKHRRQFFRVKRTPEDHTEELKAAGLRLECLKLETGDPRKVTGKYRCLDCSATFDRYVSSTIALIQRMRKGSKNKRPFCPECKANHFKKKHSDKVFEATKGQVSLISDYVDAHALYKFRYNKCGCVVTYKLRHIFRLRSFKCPVCYPHHIWFRFKFKGKRFKVRSWIEKAFIEYMVNEKGYSIHEIEYEPKDGKIDYYDSFHKKWRTYTPDFKVRGVYVEVKDRGSLGLVDYHWQEKEEALVVNRDKYKAAMQKLGEYRIALHVKGSFYKVRNFWTKSEKQRLLAI